MKRLVLCLCLLAACAVEPPETVEAEISAVDGGVACPPVQTSSPVEKGDVLTTGLRQFTVNNGIVRLQYGARGLDFRDSGVNIFGGPVFQNDERHMDHFLEARHTDAPEVATTPGCRGTCHTGTHWHDAVYPWYGDGVAFSSATVSHDAERMVVLRADDDAVELAYEWDEVRLDASTNQQCILGAYPECGPTDRDSTGGAVYKRNAGDQVLSIKKVKLWKTVRIERCSPGYYVSLRSDPPLKWAEQGPRAIRLGYVSTKTAFDCTGSNVARHPDAGQHISLGTTGCIADLPAATEGHEGWPFLRFMLTYQPTPMQSLQYSSTQLGSPGAHDLYDYLEHDGRPYPWQAFVGAVEYVSPNHAAEPTANTLQLVQDALPTFPER